jgi:orotate phosphoribosyltransferase-like protein
VRKLEMQDLPPRRRLAIRLLRSGLILPSEAARELRVSRQTVSYWLRDTDIPGARRRRVALMFKLLADTPWALADHSRDIPGFQDMANDTD